MLHIVIGKYLEASDEVRLRLKEHHNFLETFHRNGVFLLSGAQSSGEGNIIVARTETREELVDILEQDTLFHCGLIAYETIEFALNPRTLKWTEELFRGGRTVSDRAIFDAFSCELAASVQVVERSLTRCGIEP